MLVSRKKYEALERQNEKLQLTIKSLMHAGDEMATALEILSVPGPATRAAREAGRSALVSWEMTR